MLSHVLYYRWYSLDGKFPLLANDAHYTEHDLILFCGPKRLMSARCLIFCSFSLIAPTFFASLKQVNLKIVPEVDIGLPFSDSYNPGYQVLIFLNLLLWYNIIYFN